MKTSLSTESMIPSLNERDHYRWLHSKNKKLVRKLVALNREKNQAEIDAIITEITHKKMQALAIESHYPRWNPKTGKLYPLDK